MSIIKPLVCYYSATNPLSQGFEQNIPNYDTTSTTTAAIFLQNNPLYNDLNEQIGILKTDGTYFTVSDDKQYENRVWTAFFFNYGSVSFPVTFESKPNTALFAPGTLFKMPILYCSGNDIYNLKGEVEFLCYGNEVKTRSITIKFANPN
jgi:hypothetical protein